MDRQKIGRALLLTGLLTWAIMMAIIVINNIQTGAKPTVAFSLVTVGCWVVFFIGKTMLKTREPRLPDA